MILAVDIGNSSIDFGIFKEDGLLIAKSKISTVKTKSSDEYAVIIRGVFELNNLKPSCVKGAIIASVVPPLTVTIARAIKKIFEVDAIEVGPGIKTGLNIRIDSQSELGADIVANSVAALSMYSGPLLIVDLGTATTFSLIDEKNVFQGVVISPGVRTGLDVLSRLASNLPDVSIAPPKHIIGKNTAESMNSGALYGHAFMIDGFIKEMKQHFKLEEMTTIATGGLSQPVLPLCSSKIEYIPDLTLIGLKLIYSKNAK